MANKKNSKKTSDDFVRNNEAALSDITLNKNVDLKNMIESFNRTSLFVNVKDAPYKAKGDGIKDDTPAIHAAINHLREEGGGSLFFPDGVYCISATLPLDNSINLIGSGTNSKIKAVSRIVMVSYTNRKVSRGYWAKIINLFLDGNDKALTGIDLSGMSEAEITNVIVRHVKGTGITMDYKVQHCYYNFLNNIRTEWCGRGVYIRSNANSISGLQISNCTNIGLEIAGTMNSVYTVYGYDNKTHIRFTSGARNIVYNAYLEEGKKPIQFLKGSFYNGVINYHLDDLSNDIDDDGTGNVALNNINTKMENQPNSASSTVNDLRKDLNDLLVKLRNAGLMKSD